MNDGLACGQCGTPRMGSRFCTTCGAPLATAGVEAEFGIIPAAPVVPTAPAPVDAAPMPPPWEVLSSPSPTPESAPTRVPARRTWRNVLALLVVGALGLSCWALMHGGERHVVTGTVLLVDSSLSDQSPGAQCSGSGGYGDISGGAAVVLTDGSGTTVSTAVLSDGEFDGSGCVFSFVLRDVGHANFYGLAVAGSNRGRLQYSYSQLAHGDWSVQLSLGDV